MQRVLQCLVCWRSWQINKILCTYKRKEDRKQGGDLQRVQNCAKPLREGLGKMIALLHVSCSAPPALSFRAEVRTVFTSAASLQANSQSYSALHLPLYRQEAADRQTDEVTGSQWSEVWRCCEEMLFEQSDDLVFSRWHLLAVMSTRLQPGMATTPFISRHKDRAISKPLELSTLAFLSPLQRPTRVMKGFWGGAGSDSSKYRALDGEEWGLKEVSHSQWAVIKESGSFFQRREGWGSLN